MRVRYRRRMRAAGNESGEVSHVNEEKRVDRIRDLTHALEIEDARVSAAASDDHLRLLAFGDVGKLVVVNGLSVFAHAVCDHFVSLAGKIQRVAMGKMSAMREIETK